MLSIYTKYCGVLLEIIHTNNNNNNETKRISVEEYLNSQCNSKSKYCVQCKQWITINKIEQHNSNGGEHSMMQREILGQMCLYHPFRKAIAFCVYCRVELCCVCLKAFDIHKKHFVLLIKEFECDEYVDEMERQCKLHEEQLMKYKKWLDEMINKQYSEDTTCNGGNDSNKGITSYMGFETVEYNKQTNEDQLAELCKGILLYEKLFLVYTQLFDNYNNKRSIVNYYNIIHNIYNKQCKLTYFHSLSPLIQAQRSNKVFPFNKLNRNFFQPFPSVYTLHSLTSITVKDNLLCMTGLKSNNNVLALGYADKILFYSTQSGNCNIYQIGYIALGASCIKEGKDNVLYLSTPNGINIINLHLSYTSYTVITVIDIHILENELGCTNIGLLGELIIYNNDIIHYIPNSISKNIRIYTLTDNNKDYAIDKLKPFELPIYKLMLTNKQYPVLICCLQIGIKIIAYKTKVNLISITEAVYYPIEINEGTVLCFGKNESVLMMGMSSIFTSNILILNNDTLGKYNGLKYCTLLLNGNDVLMCNGTSFNVVEFNEDKFIMLDTKLDVDLECNEDEQRKTMLIEHIKKDQYVNEYMIAIVNKNESELCNNEWEDYFNGGYDIYSINNYIFASKDERKVYEDIIQQQQQANDNDNDDNDMNIYNNNNNNNESYFSFQDKDGNVLCSYRNAKEYVQSNVMEIQFNEHKRKPIVTTMQYLVNDFAIIDKPKPKVFVIENVDAFDMHKQQDKIEIINTEEENRNVIHNEYYCYINNSGNNSIERDKLNQQRQNEYEHIQSRNANVNNMKCVTSRNKRNKMLYTPPMTYVNSYNDNVNTNSYMYHNEKSKMSFIKLNKVKEKTYGDIHKDKIKIKSNSNSKSNKTYKQIMQPHYYNYPLAKGSKDICNNEILPNKSDNNLLHQHNHQLIISDDIRNDSLDKGLQYLEERLKEYSQSTKQTVGVNRNAQLTKQQEIFFIPSTDSRHGSSSDKVNNDYGECFNDKVKKRELVTVDDFISLQQQQQPEVVVDNYNNDEAIPFHLIKRETMYSNLINYIFGSGKVSSKKLMK